MTAHCHRPHPPGERCKLPGAHAQQNLSDLPFGSHRFRESGELSSHRRWRATVDGTTPDYSNNPPPERHPLETMRARPEQAPRRAFGAFDEVRDHV